MSALVFNLYVYLLERDYTAREARDELNDFVDHNPLTPSKRLMNQAQEMVSFLKDYGRKSK